VVFKHLLKLLKEDLMIAQKLEVRPYWKEIISVMNDGLMVIADDGTIVMVNEAFSEMTGYEKDEIVGKECSILCCDVCSLARRGGEEKWCLLFNKSHFNVKRCLIMRKDGSFITVNKNGSQLRNKQGKILGVIETLVDLSEVAERDQKIEELHQLLDKQTNFYGMVGESAVMREVFRVIERAAQSDAPVIIYGDSGTGKELVANAIHQLGWRKDGPYVQLNCVALNESILESELFGHTKGAFTGAYRNHQGRFEIADGGDIFLDEIADIPLSTQVKLLRILESKQFERVGDNRPVFVDVRIICATNRDIKELVSKKLFREDLFFRINVIPVHLPPLRDRKEDIPLLVDHFIKMLRPRSKKNIRGLTPEAMRLLIDYPWPGNVRELKGVMEYAFVVADKGMISTNHLPPELLENQKGKSYRYLASEDRDEAEKAVLLDALRKCNGNQTKAAEILGVTRVTVWHRMKKYGIDLKKDLSSL
jgi:two-component system response regulator HydG